MIEPLPPICILAGGLGTRLGSTVRDTPKPLLTVAGEPFILHQLRLLATYGAREAVLCVGYLGDQIVERVGPERFGIRISYSHDGPTPLGTLGAVRQASTKLGSRFLVLYGDTYLRIDYATATGEWEASGFPAMMTVLRNDGRWDNSNASFDGSRVTAYDKQAPTPVMKWIDYGLGGLTPETLDLIDPHLTDLSDLYHRLASGGELFGFAATERFYEIGTPAALAETNLFMTGHLPHSGPDTMTCAS